jgi:hypothetical protein
LTYHSACSPQAWTLAARLCPLCRLLQCLGRGIRLTWWCGLLPCRCGRLGLCASRRCLCSRFRRSNLICWGSLGLRRPLRGLRRMLRWCRRLGDGLYARLSPSTLLVSSALFRCCCWRGRRGLPRGGLGLRLTLSRRQRLVNRLSDLFSPATLLIRSTLFLWWC